MASPSVGHFSQTGMTSPFNAHAAWSDHWSNRGSMMLLQCIMLQCIMLQSILLQSILLQCTGWCTGWSCQIPTPASHIKPSIAAAIQWALSKASNLRCCLSLQAAIPLCSEITLIYCSQCVTVCVTSHLSVEEERKSEHLTFTNKARDTAALESTLATQSQQNDSSLVRRKHHKLYHMVAGCPISMPLFRFLLGPQGCESPNLW